MKEHDECPEKDCGGEMILSGQAGWSAAKKLICSNPFCPGKKKPSQTADVELPASSASGK